MQVAFCVWNDNIASYGDIHAKNSANVYLGILHVEMLKTLFRPKDARVERLLVRKCLCMCMFCVQS